MRDSDVVIYLVRAWLDKNKRWIASGISCLAMTTLVPLFFALEFQKTAPASHQRMVIGAIALGAMQFITLILGGLLSRQRNDIAWKVMITVCFSYWVLIFYNYVINPA